MPGATTIYGLVDHAGRPLTAMFAGEGASEAADAWAQVLYEMRDTLAAKAEASRKRDRRLALRRLRYGDEGERAGVNAGDVGPELEGVG